jgi:ABC-type uncharacterized transport system auxiliary subunit
LAVRTLFFTLAICLSFAGCGDDKKAPETSPKTKLEPAESTDAAPAKTGEVKRMSPTEVKKEVERVGSEYTDKVDESLDL